MNFFFLMEKVFLARAKSLVSVLEPSTSWLRHSPSHLRLLTFHCDLVFTGSRMSEELNVEGDFPYRVFHTRAWVGQGRMLGVSSILSHPPEGTWIASLLPRAGSTRSTALTGWHRGLAGVAGAVGESGIQGSGLSLPCSVNSGRSLNFSEPNVSASHFCLLTDHHEIKTQSSSNTPSQQHLTLWLSVPQFLLLAATMAHSPSSHPTH